MSNEKLLSKHEEFEPLLQKSKEKLNEMGFSVDDIYESLPREIIEEILKDEPTDEFSGLKVHC